MKLDWKRAGCASIAEHNGFTAHVIGPCEDGTWNTSIFEESSDDSLIDDDFLPTREDAENACESWLEQNDRPEWHDCGENGWLSWAEWRGWRIAVRPHGIFPEQVQWQATSERDCGCMTGGGGLIRVEVAKDAAEKWVREQGA